MTSLSLSRRPIGDALAGAVPTNSLASVAAMAAGGSGR